MKGNEPIWDGKIIGTLHVNNQSIAVDPLRDPDVRIITLHNMEASDVFTGVSTDSQLYCITVGDGFVVYVDDNTAGAIGKIFVVSDVLEYVADIESGHIDTLRLAGYSYLPDPKLGSVPEINVSITRMLQYKSVLAVWFSSANGADTLIQQKYATMSHNGKIYRLQNVMAQQLHVQLDHEVLLAFAGYVATFSEDGPVSKTDLETMRTILQQLHFC